MNQARLTYCRFASAASSSAVVAVVMNDAAAKLWMV